VVDMLMIELASKIWKLKRGYSLGGYSGCMLKRGYSVRDYDIGYGRTIKYGMERLEKHDMTLKYDEYSLMAI